MFLSVAPFVGAWIEIGTGVDDENSKSSLRSSERGLKSVSTFNSCGKV